MPRKLISSVLIVAGLAVAHPVLADDSSRITDLIDNSFGYTQIGVTTLLIEGEKYPEICRFDEMDAYFAAVAAGDTSAAESNHPGVVCLPLSKVSVIETGTGIDSVFDLATELDEAEGRISFAPNTLLIEGYENINLCHFNLPDAYFAALTAGEEPVEADLPSATCLPLNEVFQ